MAQAVRTSQFPLNTQKETPADAEVISHQLMMRAGFLRKLAAGLYTWTPLGLRVLRKAEAIVREEMNRAGCLEILMPAVQPAELWQESGRWDFYGDELLRMQDRHQRNFCFGPTHEEVVTDYARRELKSYKQLPICWYQIQTKFRDERRPRFGVMRAREFLMKDGYSFHLDDASLQSGYENLYNAYCAVFTRMGLNFRPVRADTGQIGGQYSHEFHVLADSGEDDIAFSDASDYAANVELAEALAPSTARSQPSQSMQTADTPKETTIEQVSSKLDVAPQQCVKTLFIKDAADGVIAVVLRGDHELNEVKAEKLAGVRIPVEFAEEQQVRDATGSPPGFVGPVGLSCPIVVDHAAAQLADFVCGANQPKQHLTGVNWGRDLPEPQTADIRNVVAGDPSPDGQGTLQIARGIEVGHVFQLGTKYSEAMNVTVQAEDGSEQPVIMGTYGIGVSRCVAAAIEQNHDDNGIIWPTALAPFQVALVPMNAHKSELVKDTTDKLYQTLTAAGIDVLLDDRDARPGVKFADIELIGIPHRLVIGERSLANGEIEYRSRQASDNDMWPLDQTVARLQASLSTSN